MSQNRGLVNKASLQGQNHRFCDNFVILLCFITLFNQTYLVTYQFSVFEQLNVAVFEILNSNIHLAPRANIIIIDHSFTLCSTASCKIGIKRGRILYNGKTFWIEDFEPNKILHADIVFVYCMNKENKCGYAVSTQCIDGKLNIPACFEGETRAQAFFFLLAIFYIKKLNITIKS